MVRRFVFNDAQKSFCLIFQKTNLITLVSVMNYLLILFTFYLVFSVLDFIIILKYTDFI